MYSLKHNFEFFVISGKQKNIRLTPMAALNNDSIEGVKIVDSKGCSMFCVGAVRQGTSSCLCVAVKRQIIVYELNRTKQRHRRVKEILCPGTVQHIEMCSERLCVGYPSSFALYSVQGEGPPVGEYIIYKVLPLKVPNMGFAHPWKCHEFVSRPS